MSEIEDYARVELRRLPDAGVKGTAVADLTHLLAELVENAAQFSPPHTKVRISGEPVGNGYVLEIEDRGLGMGKEVLGEANRRVEQTEVLDLFDSDRLGLFVVSRLSARHHIKVQLRTSPYGGTTAVVLLPTELLHSGPPVERTPPGPVPAPAPAFPAPVAVPALEPPAAREPHEREAPERAAHPQESPQRSAPVTALHRGPRPTPADRTELTGTSDDSELPRRVRLAGLVPQLREEPPPEPPERPEPPENTADGPVRAAGRSPEQVRDRMTAYRDGWLRGTGPTPGGATRPPTEGDHA